MPETTADTIPATRPAYASRRVPAAGSPAAANRETVGVVLMNTGTPASPDPDDIRPYLDEFLSDPRLISCPRPIWNFVLKRFILPRRPFKTAPAYERIWTPDGSPFMVESLKQRDGLQALFDRRRSKSGAQNPAEAKGPAILVEIAMRYGEPRLGDALDRLAESGCSRVLCLPLFPHTSRVTTESCKDLIAREAAARPRLRIEIIEGYADDPLWSEALASSVREAWHPDAGDGRPAGAAGSKLLFAFHSIPLSNVRKGDTYVQQIEESVRRTAALLGLSDEDWGISYQSRFDNRNWVRPTPETVLTGWAAQGVRDVAVVAPGFATDCLETLRENDSDQRATFLRACAEADDGLEPDDAPTPESTRAMARARFTYIPCLNARPDHLVCLAHVIEDHL